MPGARARTHLAAGIALLALAVAVYAPLLRPGQVPYSPHSDLVAEHLATKQVGFAAWSGSGALPLWRDDQFLGGPALTNPQSLYLHPAHFLFLLLEPLRAVGPTLVLQLWIAALGAYALARALGASALAALFSGAAGLVFFKLVLVAYAGWLMPLATLSLVPALLAALVRVAERPALATSAVLAALCAVALAGGTPQTLYYAALLGAPYLIVAARAQREEPAFRRLARAGLAAAGALALGLACNAWLWLPLASEAPLLSRAGTSYTWFLSGHGLAVKQLATLLHPHALGAPFAPGVRSFEPWEDAAYFGLAPLLLALTAAWAPARPSQRYFAFALAFGVLLSLDTPLLRLAYEAIPGYAAFRLPARILFVTGFIGIGLAGAGLDHWLARLRARGLARAAPLLGLAALALVLAEGTHYARRYLATAPAETLLPDPDHPARALARPDAGGARTAIVGRTTLSYGWSEALGLELVNGYDPYNYAHYKSYVALLDSGLPRGSNPGNWVDLAQLRRPDLLDELSVRWVVAASPLELPQLAPVGFARAVRNFVLYRGMLRGPLHLYENRSARPYARFAARVEPVASLDQMLQRMAQQRLVGQAYVLGAEGAQPEIAADAARARAERPAAGRVTIQTEAASRRLLVVSEVFHPGWRARIDGAAARPLQVNLCLLGLWVPPGSHRIELELVPLRFRPALGISLAALALLVALCAVALVRRAAPR